LIRFFAFLHSLLLFGEKLERKQYYHSHLSLHFTLPLIPLTGTFHTPRKTI
jgi:hypothetical protein